MGESMGGAVTIAALATGVLDADGVILVAPAVWSRSEMPFYQTASLWIAAHTLPWLKLTARGLDILPSDNIEMLRALGADPLVIKETRIDAIWGLVDLMDQALAASALLDDPALILYGSRDEVIPPNATAAMLARLPPAPAGSRTVAIYDDGYHMLLRDLQAPVVWRDILSWLRDAAAPLPSGADRRSLVAEE
jgi:alpha-beta hydrolase superfamily lysophospholipase